jgi:hypothetical protein
MGREREMAGLENSDHVPRAVRSIYPPLVLIAATIVMIVWSLRYNETASLVPLLVCYALLVLAFFDLVCRFDTPVFRPLRDFWGADFQNREMKHDPQPAAEVSQILWIVGCVAAMMLIGILPTVPIFILFYTIINGRRPWLESLVVTAIVFAFVYVVFEMLLDYRLYRGAFFDERGFQGW